MYVVYIRELEKKSVSHYLHASTYLNVSLCKKLRFVLKVLHLQVMNTR